MMRVQVYYLLFFPVFFLMIPIMNFEWSVQPDFKVSILVTTNAENAVDLLPWFYGIGSEVSITSLLVGAWFYPLITAIGLSLIAFWLIPASWPKQKQNQKNKNKSF